MTNNLLAWSVEEDQFPHGGTISDRISFCLKYAVLAPSTYNNQPWYFIVDGDTVSVMADRRYALPVIDPEDRALVMSCAGALFNLRLAIRYFGYREDTQFLPNSADSDLLARVKISPNNSGTISDEEKALFKAILNRQMNCSAFDARPIPADVLERLQNAARKEGAWLHICEAHQRKPVAHIIAEADHIQMSKKHFRRELAAWITERRYKSGDGFPDYAEDFDDMMASSAARIIRRFERQPGEIVSDDDILAGCPVIAALCSERGGTVQKLYAGQALMRVMLQAEAEGLALSTLNQPCEVPDMRLKIHDEISLNQGRAQFILRIGYGQRAVPRTPRRPLESFIEAPAQAQAYRNHNDNRDDIPSSNNTGKRSGLGRFLNPFG